MIQRAVFAHLRARGQPDAFAFHPPNGGWRSPIEAAILKGLGVVPGVPDVIIIHRGTVYALELKSAHGRLTPAQISCREALQNAGAIWAIATNIDEAIFLLETWGVVRGRQI